MSRPPEPWSAASPEGSRADPLARGFRLAYGAGLALCVGWPVLLQLLLGRVIRPGAEPPGETIRQLGYSFTGLTVACAGLVAWRWNRVRAGFGAADAARRGRILVREVLLYSALFALSSLFGILYYAMGGLQVERHARGFIALSTVMFFIFVPRLQAWREAAQRG